MHTVYTIDATHPGILLPVAPTQEIVLKHMIDRLKNKKAHVVATFGAVAIAGVVLFQGAIPGGAREPKIDAITPSQGPAGIQVVISGSGFTTSVQGIVGTKVKDSVYAPGNYVLIKDEVVSQPILSPDGTTLTVRIDLVTELVKRECEEKFSKKNPEPCKVPIKIVNAYGKPSNDVQFTITGREYKKLTYTIEKLDMPAPAVIHAIVPGEAWSGDEVMRIRISAPASNEQTISGVVFGLNLSAGTPGGTPVPCSYFSFTDPLTGSTGGNGGTWLKHINYEFAWGEGIWGGTMGMDGGIFSYSSPWSSLGCLFYVGGIPIAPGAHSDYSVHMKMYAQNYALKADGTYTPPADQFRTFVLMAKATGVYVGSGYYVVDNSPDNGYIKANAYPGDGGATFNMGLSTLITSDPIKIIPQSIPTAAGYFP